jgi:hypothetical protein
MCLSVLLVSEVDIRTRYLPITRHTTVGPSLFDRPYHVIVLNGCVLVLIKIVWSIKPKMGKWTGHVAHRVWIGN